MDVKIEKLKYQKNKVGYNFMLLTIVFSLLGLFQIINYHSYTGSVGEMKVIPDMEIAAEIMLGILMVLGLFLTGEFMKYYSIKASYVAIGLGSINFLRIFITPLKLFQTGQIPTQTYIWIIILLAISFITAIIASIFTLNKGYKLKKAIESEG